MCSSAAILFGYRCKAGEIEISADVKIGEIRIANGFCVDGQENASKEYVVFGVVEWKEDNKGCDGWLEEDGYVILDLATLGDSPNHL